MSDEIQEDAKDEVVKLGDFKTNFKNWCWKLGYTLISAKVLVTTSMIALSFWLVVKKHEVEAIVGEDVYAHMDTYLTGKQLVDLWSTVITVFMGARVAVPIIETIGKTVTAYYEGKNGKSE